MFLHFVLAAALYYVFAQSAMLYHLKGGWRFAAFLPLPLIAAAMCFGVLTSVFGPILSELIMRIALPLGTAYLIVLATVWTVCDRLSHRKTSAP